MRFRRVITAAAATAAVLLGGTATAVADEPVTKPLTSFSYQSEAGDWVGGGLSGSYAAPTVPIEFWGTADKIEMFVDVGTGGWSATITPPRGQKLHHGTYLGAERPPFQTGRAPGLDVSGDHRGCNQVYGEFTIDQIEFDADGKVTVFDASFVQRCEADAPAMRGTITYQAMPMFYSVVGEPGAIGGGQTKTYRGATTIFGLTGGSSYLKFTSSGLQDEWSVELSAPWSNRVLAPGRYENAMKAEVHGQERPGLNARFQSGGCGELTGSFVIHELRYHPDSWDVSALSVDFEQRCVGSTGTLRGSIRFNAAPQAAS